MSLRALVGTRALMARYRGTVHSNRPLEETFDYLARFSSVAEWDPNAKEASDLDGPPVRVGSRFRVVVSLAGRGRELTYVVTEYERPHRVRLIAESAVLTSDDVIEVHEEATGVVVAYDADVRLKGPLRFADPLMRLGFGRVGSAAEKGLQEELARPGTEPAPAAS